jgi:hypothetical protein
MMMMKLKQIDEHLPQTNLKVIQNEQKVLWKNWNCQIWWMKRERDEDASHVSQQFVPSLTFFIRSTKYWLNSFRGRVQGSRYHSSCALLFQSLNTRMQTLRSDSPRKLRAWTRLIYNGADSGITPFKQSRSYILAERRLWPTLVRCMKLMLSHSVTAVLWTDYTMHHVHKARLVYVYLYDYETIDCFNSVAKSWVEPSTRLNDDVTLVKAL